MLPFFKTLKDLFSRSKESFEPSDITYLVYKNRFNEVKPYAVLEIERTDKFLTVYDLDGEKVKTFKPEWVLDECDTQNETLASAERFQAQYEIIPRNKTGRIFANPEKKLEVCFTGFPNAEKERLIQLAKDNDLFVRTGVANTLGLLICGESAGWAKLKKAGELNIPKVYGAEGFENFLETGEVEE